MKITEQEQELRRTRIIETAFRLFCENGIDKVSLSDVARRAGVGESTVYRYFENKPNLVLNTFRVLWNNISESLEGEVESVANYSKMTGYEQIRVLLETCKRLYVDNADYVLFSYESKLYLYRNSIQIAMSQYDGLMNVIKLPSIKALEKGKRDGTIPVKEDSEDLFYSIWGCVRGYIVKIVIYNALCGEDSPWQNRYDVMERGILSALSSGWRAL